VHGGDRRLQLVRPDRSRGQGRGHQRDALRDQAAIPPQPVLVGQRHQLAIAVDPGRPARLGQQHQRQQPLDLAVARASLVQRPGEPDRLPGQVVPVDLGAG
jgi:hypothetical protein